jgi:hypothetical protein
MTVIVCAPKDVWPYPCVCEANGWDHEWEPAPTSTNGLHWCANCDCCTAHMDPPPDADGG